MANNDQLYAATACCCLVFIVVFPFSIWINIIVPSAMPTFYVQDFYVPALEISKHSNTTDENHSINFDIKLKNQMFQNEVLYDTIEVTLFYGSSLPIANHSFPKFYQHKLASTNRRGTVEARGLPWDVAVQKVELGSVVLLKVELATKVKLQQIIGWSGWKKVRVGTYIEVDATGNGVGRKPIELRSIRGQKYSAVANM